MVRRMNRSGVTEYADVTSRGNDPIEEGITVGSVNIDMVNHPPHYARLDPEPIDVIEAWKLPYHLGNVLKYMARWDAKDGLQDLKKARWYLDRFVEKVETNPDAR